MRVTKTDANGVPILACEICNSQEFNLLLIEDEPLPIVACNTCGLKYGEFREFGGQESIGFTEDF